LDTSVSATEFELLNVVFLDVFLEVVFLEVLFLVILWIEDYGSVDLYGF
jgi:hypothetical protein